MRNDKVLCFTNSYRRPYNLYHTINSILNQSYQDLTYSIGISIDKPEDEDLYRNLLSDFLTDKRIKIFFHTNLDQHDNYLFPIRQVDYRTYNVFAKIDDDDIYKKQYLKQSIETLKKSKADIVSSTIQYEINNNQIYRGIFDNVGGYWSGDLNSNIKFGMPFSYVFNTKCLDVLLNTTAQELYTIHPFEDPGWRTKWREAGIISYVISQSDLAIYHIHGKNISSSPWLIDNNYLYINNDFFTMCLFRHPYWECYVIINKAHNIVYNIQNNDLGTCSIDQDSITIKWDKYNQKETFSKKIVQDKIFIYEHQL
jgi:hypothetical protein